MLAISPALAYSGSLASLLIAVVCCFVSRYPVMAGSSEADNNSSSTGLEVEVAVAGGGGGGGEAVASTVVTGGAAVTTGEMAAALVSEGLKTEKDDDEVVYGFQRPEMQKKVALVGSVEHYERHVFLCYHAPESWPSKIEKAEYDPLPNSLVSALRNRKTDLPKKTRLTVLEGQNEPFATNGDLLIFPDMVKYKGLGESDVESFVDEVLVAGKEWALGTPEPLTGFHVFICGHGTRDKRCGSCGPPLKEIFLEEISKLGLEDQVFIRLCSHVGGHKYAGNVIIFGHSENGIVTGHWYGYVTPDDVPELIEQHIGQGKVIDRLWRGQMGLTEDQQKEWVQERIAAGLIADNEVPRNCACAEVQELVGTNGTVQQNGSISQETKTCQKCAPVLLPRIGSRDLHKMCGDAEEEEAAVLNQALPKDKKSWSCNFFKIPRWVEDWEVGDTKALLAVVGAATCVVLAYHLYRTSAQKQ